MLRPTSSFKLFFRLLVLYLTIMTLCRLTFLLFNPEFFNNPGINEFLNGLRFDMVPAGFALIPVTIALMSVFNLSKQGFKVARIYFIVFLAFFALLNSIDVIYFRFTLKRSTWDIINYMSTGDELATLIPIFIADYWKITIVWLIMVFLIIYGSAFALKQHKKQNEKLFTKIIYDLLMIAIIIVGMRGGFQLKPLNIIDASRYTSGQNAPLMLNTPFTLAKTIGKGHLERKEYFSDQEKLIKSFNPLFHSKRDTIQKKKNVVIIIMESLSKEYIGYYNNGGGYTPFLDSLMNYSMVFDNAYANGKRSIEALPAIFSGLPNLMNEAFNTSPYAGNQLESLAKILKKEGYNSSFFHGGKNGTMGFDSYINAAGFDKYYGLNEYSNKDDFDGNWGIYDVPYFEYFAEMQKKMKEPFLTSIFSLSAHHPYKLPRAYKKTCNKGELEIHPMICYSDYALKSYFKFIRNETWYENSIFLITADHTAQSLADKYNSQLGIYAIPMIIFDPSIPMNKNVEKTSQQVDISPTILDYLGLESNAIFYGNSAIDPNSKGFAINYLNGIYQFVDDSYCIHFDGEKVIGVYNYKSDPILSENIYEINDVQITASLTKLKAIIQLYNLGMIENNIKYND